jgi:hypothetical protein
MAQIFRSGAFLQQCWSVHPLCVEVRRMTNEHQLGLACTSCRFAHYLTLDSVVVRVSAALEGEEDSSNESLSPQEGQAQLLNCLSIHAMALSLCEMDVFEDLALIRCAECRRQYALTVSAFETHQK